MTDLFDENNVIFDEAIPLGMKGVLWKWTNYINGWQKRYFVLHQGVLSYFKSEEEKKFGCRGAVSLKSSKIVQPNEFDRLRFDVVAKDCVWYLKAEPSDIDKWISALTDPKAESGYESETSFPHCCSKSFTSCELSERTTDSHCIGRVLKKKLNEIETLEDILFHQIATLQAYFDACANSVTREFEPYSKEFESLNEDLDKENSDYVPECSEGNMKFYRKEHGAMAIDFKGEAISFKSTALGLLNNLRHCVEIIMQKEAKEKWRQNNQHASKTTIRNESPVRLVAHNFKDEEFFDAMGDSANTSAENLSGENNTVDVEALSANSQSSTSSGNQPSSTEEQNDAVNVKALSANCGLSSSSDGQSSFTKEMDAAVKSHIRADRLALSELWQCIHQEGSMFVYRKEVVENGTILDPLKMVHSVEGITGFELCWYFWHPQYRMDWETTLESTKVIEQIDNKTIISYQIHKRVWPTAQRDSCLLSRLDSVEENKDFPTWIVVNRTVEHPEAPIIPPKIRILVDVALTCETKLKTNADVNNLTRDDLICDLTYVASVHPGGWAPIAAVRAVAKREFPRFLSHFTKFVIDNTKNTSIRFN